MTLVVETCIFLGANISFYNKGCIFTKIVFTIKKPSINDLKLSSSEVITAFHVYQPNIYGFKNGNLEATSENHKIRTFNEAFKSLCTFHLV
jgi:predicted XRE-type DNA-binding protein